MEIARKAFMAMNVKDAVIIVILHILYASPVMEFAYRVVQLGGPVAIVKSNVKMVNGVRIVVQNVVNAIILCVIGSMVIAQEGVLLDISLLNAMKVVVMIITEKTVLFHAATHALEKDPRSTLCNSVTGMCSNGCVYGYKGFYCENECDDGKWGKDCQYDCGNCLSSPCDKLNGDCTGGCAAGYKTTRHCKTECDGGWYGINCERSCSVNCNDVCDKKTGICPKCKNGWKGHNCTKECTYGEWGENCQHACGKCKNEETCNRFNGACVNGCLPGYKQTDQLTISKDVGLNARYTELSKIMSFSLGIISLIVILYNCITLLLRNV